MVKRKRIASKSRTAVPMDTPPASPVLVAPPAVPMDIPPAVIPDPPLRTIDDEPESPASPLPKVRGKDQHPITAFFTKSPLKKGPSVKATPAAETSEHEVSEQAKPRKNLSQRARGGPKESSLHAKDQHMEETHPTKPVKSVKPDFPSKETAPTPKKQQASKKHTSPVFSVPRQTRQATQTKPAPSVQTQHSPKSAEEDNRPKIRRKQVARKVRIEDFNTKAFYPFISLKAKTTFEELIRGKQPIKERALDLKGDCQAIKSIIKSLGWEHFCAKPDEGGLQLVKEFYSNLVHQVGDKVFVRGIWVTVSSEEINRVIIAPNCEEDAYSDMVDQGIPPLVLTQKLCKPEEEVVWTTGKNNQPLSFPTSSLLPHLVPLLKFICCRLLPTTHVSHITMDRAILLLAMVEKRGVDAGWIIANNITESSGATKALWFPSIITKLCTAAGVLLAKGEERVKAGLQITVKAAHDDHLHTTGTPSTTGPATDELKLLSTKLNKFINHQTKWNSFMKHAWQETLSSIQKSSVFAGSVPVGGASSSKSKPAYPTLDESSREEGAKSFDTPPRAGGKTISERFTTPSTTSSYD